MEVVNFNTVLMELFCTECKSAKVCRILGTGGHCFACGLTVQVLEEPKIDGRIIKLDEYFVCVSLVGDVVDKVLDLGKKTI